ncbi:hypothetical protein F383_20469 [Gossypium arboreum]|uniref:Uncharacterized protein n=1 Tax=Gossypium arboreum TaxID=29729 RepID=A0A0B0NN85_GOSAR|nr:hypothetical protein F383_20469 [Gossypium arboreum]
MGNTRLFTKPHCHPCIPIFTQIPANAKTSIISKIKSATINIHSTM